MFNRQVKTIFIFGLTLFSYVIAWELIPSHVWISRGCLGYDDSGWRSQWKDDPNFYSTIVKHPHVWYAHRPDIRTYGYYSE